MIEIFGYTAVAVSYKEVLKIGIRYAVNALDTPCRICNTFQAKSRVNTYGVQIFTLA